MMRSLRIFFIIVCVLVSSCSHAEQKEIYAKDIVKLLQKGKDVRIIGKIIMDDFDFTVIENCQLLSTDQIQNVVSSNVFFCNCVFMGNVTACNSLQKVPVHTRFEQNLVFQNCDFRGDVSFQSAVVMGTANFVKSKFRKKADFTNVAICGKDSYFSEIEAEGPVSMIYASFLGNLYLMDGQFQKELSLQNVMVNGKLMANGMKCSSNAEFDMASFRGRTIFNYSMFEKPASFVQSRFFDDAEFIGTKVKDSANFENTYFFGKVLFDDKEIPCSRVYNELINQ